MHTIFLDAKRDSPARLTALGRELLDLIRFTLNSTESAADNDEDCFGNGVSCKAVWAELAGHMAMGEPALNDIAKNEDEGARLLMFGMWFRKAYEGLFIAATLADRLGVSDEGLDERMAEFHATAQILASDPAPTPEATTWN